VLMTQVFNCPEQALVVLPIDALDQIPGKCPGITPAFIRFEMGMTQKRLMDVSVVIKRNQIRGSAQSTAHQRPWSQCVMVIINDIDVFPADALMLE